MKLNGTQHHLVYADDVNILGGSVLTVEKKTETMLVGSKEIGLEVKADKTKYMVMFRDQNAGRYQNMKIDKRFFRRVEDLKYLRTTFQ